MTAEIPQRIFAPYIDRVNYAMAPFYMPMVQLMLEFDGPLNRPVLARALRLVVDAEPVLGCRFVPRWISPYWLRLPADELDRAEILGVYQGDDPNAALDDFMGRYIGGTDGPQLKALLLPDPKGDRLIVKLSHLVVDAGAAKEFAYLLGRIYRELQRDPDFAPRPNLGSRSMRQVFGRIGPIQLLKILRRFVRDIAILNKPKTCLVYPSGKEAKGLPLFLFKRFPALRVRKLTAYGAQSGATINDIMVTAQVRAAARHVGHNSEMLRYTGTVDLRRYLETPAPEALCNLSSHFFLNVGAELQDFDHTLAEVKRMIDFQKRDYIGLGKLLGEYLCYLPDFFSAMVFIMRKMYKFTFKGGNSPICLTNMGRIDHDALDFGSVGVTAAELAPPISMPPVTFTGLSGFRDTLTLSIGFYESAIPRADLEKFLEIIDKELPI